MDKKRKIIVGVSVVVGVLILGGGALEFHNYSVKAAEEEKQEKIVTMQNKQKRDIERYQKTVDGFYTNSKKEDIKQELQQDELNKMDQNIKKFEGTDLTAETGAKLNTLITDNGYAKSMLEIRNQINSLLDDKGALVDNADISNAEKKLNELKDAKPFYVDQQGKVLVNAKKQQEDINSATAKVSQLFTSDKKTEVKKDVTRTSYNQAKEAVNKIKQIKTKDKLTKNLDSVNKYLSEEEKKSQEQAEKNNQNEGNSKSETANSNEANSSGNTTNGSDDSSSKSSSNNSNGNSNSSSSSARSKDSGSSSSNGSGSTAKSSGGSNSSGNKSSGGSSSSKSSGGKSSGSTSKDTSGKTWTGKTEEKGTMKNDEGRTWGTIEW
ncbi:toxin Cry1Ac domain D-VI-related protein [Listeria monocytogenes]